MQTQEILYDSRYGRLTPEVAEKIYKSREEIKNLRSKKLECPVCGHRIEEVYGITSGIVQVKCRKCKLEEPLNLAYFRRIKPKIMIFNPYALMAMGRISR